MGVAVFTTMGVAAFTTPLWSIEPLLWLVYCTSLVAGQMSVVHFVVSFFATGHYIVLLLNFLSTALSLIKDAVLQASMIKNISTVLFFVCL